MRSSMILSSVLLAISATVSAVTTTPLTRVQRSGTHLKGSPDADRARAALLKSRTAGGHTTVPATNLAYVQYTTSVGIGDPPTYYNLVIDTGSSNTFCGAGKSYVPTNTSVPTGQPVIVTYGTGNFTGAEYLDHVTLGPGLTLTNQSIGSANSSVDFQGVDGILGVGPVDLTQGTLASDENADIPTVMDNLVSQKLVEKKVFGVYFAPATKDSDTNGALTYGGVDTGLYRGGLTYVPLTRTYPAAYYWGIDITSSAYGNHTIIPTSTAGIVDTGTTQVLLADNFFSVYMNAIPGAKWDQYLGLIVIPRPSVSSMQPLRFTIAGVELALEVSAQLIPQKQNTAWGGATGEWYGVVGKLGSDSGEGLDFILGQTFMERYYAVFDADAHRVGFAQTENTNQPQ